LKKENDVDSPKNIIITGSSGFIGSHLTECLRKIGFKVLEIDLKQGYDVTDWNQISRIEPVDTVIHLAGPTYIPLSFRDPRLFIYTNAVGTLNMMEYCRLHKAKMIFTSAYVYGIPEYLPIDEKHPVHGINPYAESKLVAERICLAYHQLYDIKTYVIRPFNLYGPSQDNRFLIPTIINQIFGGKIVLENPHPKRDYIFIDDILNAFIKMVEFEDSSFEIFNVGSGVSYTIKEIVETAKSITGITAIVEFSGKNRKNEIPETCADISKIKKILQWEPRTTLQHGLEKTINTYSQRRRSSDI
jgi:UDP-glucose 4-epimerase